MQAGQPCEPSPSPLIPFDCLLVAACEAAVGASSQPSQRPGVVVAARPAKRRTGPRGRGRGRGKPRFRPMRWPRALGLYIVILPSSLWGILAGYSGGMVDLLLSRLGTAELAGRLVDWPCSRWQCSASLGVWIVRRKPLAPRCPPHFHCLRTCRASFLMHTNKC